MRHFIVGYVAFGLLGCTTNTKRIIGPRGQEQILIVGLTLERCYAKAREVCGNYRVVNSAGGSLVEMIIECQSAR